MAPEERLKLLEAIKQAVKETNRGVVINGLRTDVTHLRLKYYSLFKTWFCREVRSKHIVSYSSSKQVTLSPNLTIYSDNFNHQISHLSLSCSAWYMKQDEIQTIARIFKELPYDDLVYFGKLYPVYNPAEYSKQKLIVDVMSSMSFHDLSSIKFK